MSDDSFFAEFDPRGGAAASPAASADGDQWVCSACTFLNPLALEKCKMCDTPMPVLDVAPSGPFASFSHAPRATPAQPQPQPSGVRSPPPASAISPAKASESTPPPGKSAGSGPLRRMRTGSKNKDTDKAVHSASFDALSVSETSLGGKDSGSHAATPTSSPISPGTGTLEKKKSRNLFSLGRHKKKEERKDESPEKDDKKHDVDDENAGAHEKEGKEHAHHHHHHKDGKDSKDAKDSSKDGKEDEERRKRAGSFRGWVTRKGRKGDKEDEEDAKEQQGKESENEDEVGESAEFSGDWRAIMASKRSVLIVLDNLTEETIMRRGAGKLSSGSWGRYPPAVVQAHGVVEFGAYGTTLKGTKGRCIYMIDGYDSTFIFQWSNSKVGSPEVRCIQHPKEFKVEGRGRIEKCAEVTFSIFSASGPKPKRPEPSAAAEPGAHPSSPAAVETGGHHAPDGAVVAAVPGSPPPFPIFDNLLDDAEVQAVERFVQAQTIASFGASPREVHSPPTSGGFPFPVAGHHGVLPTPGPELPADAARSFENSGRAHPTTSTMGHNPFLDPPNPFGAGPTAAPAFPQLGPATEWGAEMSGSGVGGGVDNDDDWDEDEPISSPGPKLKFSIKSKEEVVADADTTPGAFKLSSPPPAASGSKQTRRRGSTPLQDRKQASAAASSPLASPPPSDGGGGGGGSGGGGLVFRHTGPENKGEPTTPVATRAARLVQRKTGPSGAGANGSARLNRDGSAGPIAIDRKQSEEIAARRDVLFEVGRADSPSPARSPALSAAAPLSAVTPPPARTDRPTPVPAAPAAQSDAIIRQASSMMLTCGNRMQSGQFREAFLDAESALDLLRSVPDVNSVSKPLKICIDYKLAILILMEIDVLNKHPQQTPEESATIRQRAAVLAKHLSTLRLTPQHAAIAVRMAISKNIEAHNYGVASNLLQLVLSRNPPDAANLNEKLHVCKQHDETNAMPDINNLFCCRTLRLVDPTLDTTACPVCNSLYAASATGPGDQCPLCSSAAVVRR